MRHHHRALAGALLTAAVLAGCSTASDTTASDTASETAVTIAPPASSSLAVPTPSATGGGAGPKAPAKGASRAATTPSPAVAAESAAKGTAEPGGPGAAVAGDQTSVLDRLPGKASSDCAVVGSQTDVRSGSLAVGNFADARVKVAKGAANGAEVSFYVVPADAASMPGVRLRATSPTGSVRTVTSLQVEQADTWNYYRVALPVRDRGTWRLEFAAGRDTGCFRVSF